MAKLIFEIVFTVSPVDGKYPVKPTTMSTTTTVKGRYLDLDKVIINIFFNLHDLDL